MGFYILIIQIPRHLISSVLIILSHPVLQNVTGFVQHATPHLHVEIYVSLNWTDVQCFVLFFSPKNHTRVSHIPSYITCLTCLRALRARVPTYLCAFVTYLPSFFTCLTRFQFFYVAYVSLFVCLPYVRSFFYVPNVPWLFYVPSFLSVFRAFIFLCTYILLMYMLIKFTEIHEHLSVHVYQVSSLLQNFSVKLFFSFLFLVFLNEKY